MRCERKSLVLAMALAGIAMGFEAHAAAGEQPPTTTGQEQAGTQAGAAASQSGNGEKSAPDTKTRESNDEKLVQTLGTITVKGYTRSVESSIDYQRYSDAIKNVVTASDIGGLPDQSIADALSRLPGVSAERAGGQAEQMDIRGLSGNFIQTTMNGRVLPSTSGTNFTQFDDYPAELINRVEVYKTSQADLIEGGVGGTIAMHTANPLDAPKDQVLNIDARGSYNSRASQVFGDNPRSYRVSVAWQGKFLDHTLGVGLGFADLNQPDVALQFANESYSTAAVDLDGRKTFVNTGIQVNQQGGSERRRGYLATVVWQPNEHFALTADGFFSKFHQDAFQRGMRAQLFTNGVAVITNPVVSSSGALVGGTVGSIPGGFFGVPGLQAFSVETTANDQSNLAEVFSGGLNARWHYGNLTVTSDLSESHALSHTVGADVTADPFNGLGTGAPLIADQSVSFLLRGLDVGEFSVANPGMYTDLNRMAISDYGIYPTTYHDRRKAFRTTVKYDLPNNPILSSIEGGIYLSNHNYRADRAVWLYGSEWGQYFINSPDQPPLALNGSNTAVACWKASPFSGFPCFLALDPSAVLAAHGIVPNPTKQWSQNWTETQSGNVYVKDRDGFAQANIDTSVFDKRLTGNVGLRVVHTSQFSPGLQQVGGGKGVPITDGVGVTSTDYLPVNPGQTYTKYLPSLNLTLHLDDGNQLRFAAAKVLARPPIDKLKSGTASFIQNGTYNLTSGTNPMLNPLYATQYDFAFEHYWPDSSGVFVADLFFKSIKSFVETVTINNFDFAAAGYNVPINPATGKPYLNGVFQTAYNAHGGVVRGIELQFAKTHFLPGIWSGLGVGINYAYTRNGTKTTSMLAGFPVQQSLPGLSRNVASAAVFYDLGRLSTRLSATYRSPFVTAASTTINSQASVFGSETVIDYQLGYQFTKYLTGLFQLLNLTDRPTRSYYGIPEETSEIQYFGRTIYAGINLKL